MKRAIDAGLTVLIMVVGGGLGWSLFDAPPARQGVDPPGRVQAEATGWWLSSGSGVRHNERCRWYRRSTGRPCKPDEGRPCKLCGG